MDSLRLVAIVLIVAGVLGLVYGGFSYTRTTTQAKIGSLELNVKDKESVNIPIWASVAALAAGGGLLLMGKRKI
jgi:TRAP-type C4-dicarboxylate transport system permease small subunit